VLFCIDIGNTNVVMGLFSAERLVTHWRIATDHRRMADEYGMLLLDLFERAEQAPSAVEGVALASVVPPLTGVFEKLCRRYFGCQPLTVNAETRTGIRVRYDNPLEVGADRIVNAVAVYHRYGGPACVVDFGTATTFDALSAEGDYLGGAIAPGIFGYVGLVEGMVARFRAELGPQMRVIATGGLAPLLAAETTVIEAVEPWLTLEGLRLIWEMNRQGQP